MDPIGSSFKALARPTWGVERVGHGLGTGPGRFGLELGRHPLGVTLAAPYGLGPLDGLAALVPAHNMRTS